MFDEVIEGFCPRCNRMSALEIRSQASAAAPPQLLDQLDGGEEGFRSARYSIAFCPKCGGVFLHVVAKSEPSEIPYEAMLYPAPERRSIPGLPNPVRRAYESAQSCFATANYDPCAIMCRKSVQALSASLGVKTGTLDQDLRRLKETGRIEARLYEWADQVRLFGNDAAHDFEHETSKEEASDLLDFLEAFLQYVFALDQKFRDFSARRETRRLARADRPRELL